MLAPLVTVLLGKLPIVRMDVKLELRLVFSFALDVPAITFVIAHNGSGCAGRGEHKAASGDEDGLRKRVHMQSSFVVAVDAGNALPPVRFLVCICVVAWTAQCD